MTSLQRQIIRIYTKAVFTVYLLTSQNKITYFVEIFAYREEGEKIMKIETPMKGDFRIEKHLPL